jgi:membrane protein DedA with SNARE-associated domain
MGLTDYPYRRFLCWSAIGGTLWAAYTCLLAYRVGSALEDFPLASIVVSGVITTVLIGVVYWIDRRKRAEDEPPLTPDATVGT